jgi:hypothetical protein
VPLLFADDQPQAPVDPVAPATRSPAAAAKAGSARSAESLPSMSLPDLLAELGTLCRSELRVAQVEHTFSCLTKPNPLQAKALELLGVRLAT